MLVLLAVLLFRKDNCWRPGVLSAEVALATNVWFVLLLVQGVVVLLLLVLATLLVAAVRLVVLLILLIRPGTAVALTSR